MTLDLDPATQQVVDDFDAHAKKRAAELLASTTNEPLQVTREIAFCLGYKAGIVDLGAALRERHGVSVDQLAAVYAAVCRWRDAAPVPDALAGEIDDVHEQQLIAAIDAARKERP